jgi:hypothetical protein
VHGGGQGTGGRQHIAHFEAWKKKVCEAKVWVKPWLNMKELQYFILMPIANTFTKTNLGARKGSCSLSLDYSIA